MTTFNTVTDSPPTPQPVEVRWLHMSTEQKIETPCPSKFCQNVFKCGFKHTMKECADAYDRRQAETQVEQERAVRKVADSRGLAEASPPLAHMLANQYPNPVWDYPAPKGFHNRARTEEDLFREDK